MRRRRGDRVRPTAGQGRQPGACVGVAGARALLVVPHGLSNFCEIGPTVLATKRYELPDGRTATAVCGCGSLAEAMVVNEASIVPVQTDLVDDELALIGCGVTTGLGAALKPRA